VWIACGCLWRPRARPSPVAGRAGVARGRSSWCRPSRPLPPRSNRGPQSVDLAALPQAPWGWTAGRSTSPSATLLRPAIGITDSATESGARRSGGRGAPACLAGGVVMVMVRLFPLLAFGRAGLARPPRGPVLGSWRCQCPGPQETPLSDPARRRHPGGVEPRRESCLSMGGLREPRPDRAEGVR